MTAESELRTAWASFVEKAKAAHDAGYIVTLPRAFNEALLVSATAKALAAEFAAPPEPVAEPLPPETPDEQEPEPSSRKSRRIFSNKDL